MPPIPPSMIEGAWCLNCGRATLRRATRLCETCTWAIAFITDPMQRERVQQRIDAARRRPSETPPLIPTIEFVCRNCGLDTTGIGSTMPEHGLCIFCEWAMVVFSDPEERAHMLNRIKCSLKRLEREASDTC